MYVAANTQAAEPTIASFVAEDRCERQGVGRRFHRYLLRQIPDYPVTELCGLEAALCHAPMADATVESLRMSPPSDRRRRLGPGVELLSLRRSWGGWLSRRRPTELPAVPPPLEQPQQVAIRRDASGEAAIFALSPAAMAESLRLSGLAEVEVPLPVEEEEGLLRAGIWVPAGWRLTLPSSPESGLSGPPGSRY